MSQALKRLRSATKLSTAYFSLPQSPSIGGRIKDGRYQSLTCVSGLNSYPKRFVAAALTGCKREGLSATMNVFGS